MDGEQSECSRRGERDVEFDSREYSEGRKFNNYDYRFRRVQQDGYVYIKNTVDEPQALKRWSLQL